MPKIAPAWPAVALGEDNNNIYLPEPSVSEPRATGTDPFAFAPPPMDMDTFAQSLRHQKMSSELVFVLTSETESVNEVGAVSNVYGKLNVSLFPPKHGGGHP